MKNKLLFFIVVMLLLTSKLAIANSPGGIDTINIEKAGWGDLDNQQGTRPNSLTYEIVNGSQRYTEAGPSSNGYKVQFAVPNLDEWSTLEYIPNTYSQALVEMGPKNDLFPFPSNSYTGNVPNTNSITRPSKIKITSGSEYDWYSYAGVLNPSSNYGIPVEPNYIIINRNLSYENANRGDKNGDFEKKANQTIYLNDMTVSFQSDVIRYTPSNTHFTAGETSDEGKYVQYDFPGAQLYSPEVRKKICI